MMIKETKISKYSIVRGKAMKKFFKMTVLFGLLTLVLLATVSCSNGFGGLFGGEESHNHAFGDWVTKQNATCTEKGLQERICSCGEKETQEISALGHTETADAAVVPTCTTDGLTAGTHCTACGEVLVAQETVPATHDWKQIALLESATCFTHGEERRACRVCGFEENAPVAPLKHDLVKDEETQLYSCTLCHGVVFAGHIYAAIEGEYHWFEAYQACEDMGGHLVTITSKYEQAAVEVLMNFESVVSREYWIGGVRAAGEFQWITEEPFEYQNWLQGQPNFYNHDQHFLNTYSHLDAAYIGKWNDSDYLFRHSFIGEWDLDITDCEHIFTEWETICAAICWNDGEQYRICTHCGKEETEILLQLEHNFVLDEASGIEFCEYCKAAKYNGHIYALFMEERDWFEAYARCAELGGYLATITSEEEQTFIVSYCNSFNTTNNIWLGGYTDTKQWHWVTGEEFSYTNWGRGEPSMSNGNEWFAHLDPPETYPWNDLPPCENYLYYLCEFECEE